MASNAGVIIFPALDEGFRKRKKAFRACTQCKKSRIRCRTESDVAKNIGKRCLCCREIDMKCSFEDDASPFEQELYNSQLRKSGSADLMRSRFVSDLDPSSEMLQGYPDKDNIGIWVPQDESKESEETSKTRSHNTEREKRRPGNSRANSGSGSSGVSAGSSPKRSTWNTTSDRESGLNKKRRVGKYPVRRDTVESKEEATERIAVDIPPTIDNFVLSHLNALRCFELPPDDVTQSLIDIYFESIHPVFPIVEEEDVVRRGFKNNTISILLAHGIILCASRCGVAFKILERFKKHPNDRGYVRTFAATVYAKMEALLAAKVEQSPLTLLRIHALASFHSEGSEGFRSSITHLAMAFAYAHSQALHLSGGAEVGGVPTSVLRLWRALWCLDRLCAVGNSLPVMSHKIDCGIGVLDESGDSDLSWSAKYVNSVHLIDKCLFLYRPSTPIDHRNIPPIIEAHAAVSLTNKIMPNDSFDAFCRLNRDVAVILAYKRCRSQLKTDEEVCELLISNALDVLDIVEKFNNLPPHSIITYAITLTLTVFLKYFSVGTVREHWRRACQLLEGQSFCWYAAEAMSSMSRRVFEKLELESEQMEDSIQKQLDELFNSTNDTFDNLILSSFQTQTDLFGEFDRQHVDSWFS